MITPRFRLAYLVVLMGLAVNCPAALGQPKALTACRTTISTPGSYVVTKNLTATSASVQSAAVIMDKVSGQSKGFGFVEMASAEDAAKAIQQFNDTALKGRNIKVNEAKPRESSFGGSNRSGGGANRGGNRW